MNEALSLMQFIYILANLKLFRMNGCPTLILIHPGKMIIRCLFPKVIFKSIFIRYNEKLHLIKFFY